MNDRTFHLIAVNETADYRHRWGNVFTRDYSILSQINPAHILKIYLYFLYLMVAFSLPRLFMVLNKNKAPRTCKFLCFVFRSTCPFHLPVMVVHTPIFIKREFLKFIATQRNPVKPCTHRQHGVTFNIGRDKV